MYLFFSVFYTLLCFHCLLPSKWNGEALTVLLCMSSVFNMALKYDYPGTTNERPYDTNKPDSTNSIYLVIFSFIHTRYKLLLVKICHVVLSASVITGHPVTYANQLRHTHVHCKALIANICVAFNATDKCIQTVSRVVRIPVPKFLKDGD